MSHNSSSPTGYLLHQALDLYVNHLSMTWPAFQLAILDRREQVVVTNNESGIGMRLDMRGGNEESSVYFDHST